jgi:cation-transporting ATPase F
MKTTETRPLYSIPESELLSTLETSATDGLTAAQAQERLLRYGPNALARKKGTHPVVLFFIQFNQPLVYILIAAGTVTLLLREFVDSSVIFGVVLVNAIIGFIQESKALKAIEALAKSMTGETTVMRDGKKMRLPSAELTVGDLVLLQSGDKTPADLRLVKVRELQVDESTLTGESVPVEKRLGVVPVETTIGDRTNMAYSSTLVTYGTASGIVTAIGNETEIGHINKMIASADVLATPLTRSIAKFSALLLYVILGLAAVTFVIGLLRGSHWFEMFQAAVALAVGAIPEGLPAAVTITLAIGVSKMAKRHAIIRKLPAVETLGSTSVICSDKTGTLTQNQMTVQEICVGSESFVVEGVGYAPHGSINPVHGSAVTGEHVNALRECCIAGLLCNDSAIVEKADTWYTEGDPTEGALITSALKAGLSRDGLRLALPRIDTVPFESEHQYMATLHNDTANKRTMVYLKGSIESILGRCTNDLSSSSWRPEEWKERVEKMAATGLRVLAFARLLLPAGTSGISHKDVTTGCTFLGLQGMIDPPRPEAIEAIEVCHRAGIEVKMITGDHELTALAIAKKIGIASEEAPPDNRPQVLNGKKISALTDEELVAAAHATSVFARVAPEDKLRLVKALQTGNAVIAMTGDGVNDAPALQQANIGIAMGITGTEVAKETADMVLTDDNFATIKAAVEEGRGVYDNLVKFITWTLPTNFGEGLVILAAIITGTTLPISPVQILWINMTTAVALGLMLAFEPKEPGLMDRPPRKPTQPVLTGRLIARIVVVGAMLLAGAFGLFNWALQNGRGDAIARTIAVNVFVMGELFFLFNCRSLHYSMFRIGLFTNPAIIIGVSIMIVLQLLFTYAPFMNAAFGSLPIALSDWLLCIGVGVVIYLVMEAEKKLFPVGFGSK